MRMINMDNRKRVLSCMVSFLAVCALPDMMGFTEGGYICLTNSIYSFLAWVCLAVLVRKGMDRVVWNDRRENLTAFLFALAFSVCMAVGSDIDSMEYILFGDGKRIFSICCSAAALTVIIRELWACLDPGDAMRADNGETGYSKKTFCLLILSFLLCWMPVLLASYPGFFVYDAQDEVNEILTRSFTTHHPLMHVLLLGGTVAAVHKVTDSYNLGIACYMVVQMCIAAFGFAYMLDFLKRHRVRRGFRVAAFLFAAFFPVIPMYILCSTKDTPFTIALLFMLLLLYELISGTEEFFRTWKRPSGLMLSIFLMLSFRHNGVYAFLALTVILAWRALKKKGFGAHGKKVMGLLMVPVALYFAVTAFLAFLLDADSQERQEMLTVPIMQLARVHETDADSLPEDDKALLYGYLPREAMAKYSAKLSDNVKIGFNSRKYSEEPSEFWKLWLRTGISHVGTYINAWLYTSYGFWYPDTVIDAYSGIQRYTFVYIESSYFGYETEPPGVRESKLPWLDEFYRKLSLEITQQKIPVISMLFSPGFMFWFYAFTLVFFLRRREYDRALAFGMILLLWMTVLLGPTCMVRYVLVFWFACPVLAAMLFEKYTGFA